MTQGGTLYDGKIYLYIRVRPGSAEKKIVGKIDLSESIFISEEIKPCGVYEGALLFNTNAGKSFPLRTK